MKRPRSKRGVGKRTGSDQILPEYDFRKAAANQYASRYATGSSVVVLEPDVAAAFPTSGDAIDGRSECRCGPEQALVVEQQNAACGII